MLLIVFCYDRVQTDGCGIVHLGPLTGIRQIEAQLEGGLDFVELPTAAKGHANTAAAAETGACGVLRKWQIARASWWQGGLQAMVRETNHSGYCPSGDTKLPNAK